MGLCVSLSIPFLKCHTVEEHTVRLFFQIAKFLLSSGADPSVENDKGQTCLDLAEDREIFADLFPAANRGDSTTESTRKRKPVMERGEKGTKARSVVGGAEKDGKFGSESTVETKSAPAPPPVKSVPER
jgi:hypothetical protein